MGMDINYGLMVPNMKGTGKMIKLMVKENWCIQMETFMKESG
jgi:hypothetical protein